MKYEDSFKIETNHVQPEKGSVLISEPFLQDSYFQRAVVYLTEHSDDGSMGFVLNKNLDVNLNDLVKGIDSHLNIPVFLGGPVNVDTLFFLHRLHFIPNSYKVSDNIYLNGDFELLKDYINSGENINGKVKFFFGYSGWGSNQLMDEIKENSWLVGNISQEAIFCNNCSKVWEKTVSSLGDKYRRWTTFPKNPSLN
jgi:putative transcriptional regulator